MDKLRFKQKVLEVARARQQDLINDFRNRINEIRNGAGHINEQVYEMDQGSFDESSIEMINGLADQLNFAVEEIDQLDEMKTKIGLHDKVMRGSVVKTDKKTFYPSVSIEDFTVDGQKMFGISTKAPLYASLEGKKAGDVVKYDGDSYRILEVY